jgi:hypothetical protein
MAHGGYRVGSGRPRKEKKIVKWEPENIEALKDGLTPLEYMLAVMRDENVEAHRRDRMAVAATPFCHARISDNTVGKKERAVQAAIRAGEGGWAREGRGREGSVRSRV